MKIIKRYLLEHYPEHPNDVVLKNNFYPDGLKEIDIYNHYMKYKRPILEWIGNRYIAFFLMIDGKIIVKRKTKDGSFIKLTAGNFEELITGRTLEVLVQHPGTTNYVVVDIDPGKRFSRKDTLEASKFVKKIISKPLNIEKFEILNSSSRGIHVIGYMTEMNNINKLRTKLYRILTDGVDTYKKEFYIVNVKGRNPNLINFDLTSMYPNSLHIGKYSITKDGLICSDAEKGLLKVKKK